MINNIYFKNLVYDFNYFYSEAKSRMLQNDSNFTNFVDLQSISEKAFNLANSLIEKIKAHIPTIYSINYDPERGKATTFIMSGLWPKSEKKEPFSTFWK